jgi:hypothetical protein
MALGKQLVETLRRLAADGAQAAEVTATVADARARLDLVDHDRYSVALRGLEVELDAGAPPVDARAALSDCAARVIRALSYLEEPLAVWELDGGEAVAQLRSSPPQREAGEISYWEVTLRGGARRAASIARHRWAPGMPEREPVIYPATFALVGRIAASLQAALGERPE